MEKAPAVSNKPVHKPTLGGSFIARTSDNLNSKKEFRENPFSLATPGNAVEFFTTSEKYFKEVAEKIKTAQKNIFIIGWQVDFDVMLNDKERLFDCLRKALDANKELRVYVLPWASPKAPVNTHDLEALCALSLLNAGKEDELTEKEAKEQGKNYKEYMSGKEPRKMRVFVLPAMSQADQGLMTIGFSHHQKAVIIDNTTAYIGGMDMSYGRRDNNSFSLKWGWREGCERYNPCIPPIAEVGRKNRFYLTTMELVISAAMEGAKLTDISKEFGKFKEDVSNKKKEIKLWLDKNYPWAKPYIEELEKVSDKVKTYVDTKAREAAGKALEHISLMPPDFLVNFIVGGIEGTKIGNYYNKATILTAFLSGQSLDDVPPQVWDETAEDLRILLRRLYTMCLYLSDVQNTRYPYLMDQYTREDGTKSYYNMFPPGGKYHAEHQPRMPWQDVHCRIEGPTVFDLSMNFIRRWNSLQARMYAEDKAARASATIARELIPVVEFFLGTVDPNQYRYRIREDVRKMTESTNLAFKEYGPKVEALARKKAQEATAAGEIALQEAQSAQAKVVAAGEKLRKDVDELLKQFALDPNNSEQKSDQQIDAFKKQLDEKLDAYKEKVKEAASATAQKAKETADSVVMAVESIKEDGRRFIAAWQKTPEPIYIPKELFPQKTTAPKGKFQLQVLRSASRRMLLDEHAAFAQGFKDDPKLLAEEKERIQMTYEKNEKGKEVPSPRPQDNCYEAICNIISAAQHFVYIEGQFFLSGHGGNDKVDPNVFSGPMGQMYDHTQIEGFKEWDKELKGLLSRVLKTDNPDIRQLDGAVLLRIRIEDPEFFGKLKKVILGKAAISASLRIQDSVQQEIHNRVGEVLAERICKAVRGGKKFHAYIVLPIHPEGNLGDFSLMSMVHYTMQSLFNGKNSLVARVQREIYAMRLHNNAIKSGKKMGLPTAQKLAGELNREELEDFVPEKDWMQYLTILNLRNWDDLGKGPVTEQIYVHSKLVIADDSLAFLGSANINDRSLLGDRDSEIGLLIHDGEGVPKNINGTDMFEVSNGVHNLRVDLWKKHFGLAGGDLGKIQPASDLSAVLESPSDPKTWKAIQKVALANLEQYSRAFYYIPRNNADGNPTCQSFPEKDTRPENVKKDDPVRGKRGSPIWPAWHYNDVYKHLDGGEMKAWLPFEEEFWRTDEERKKRAEKDGKKRRKLEMRGEKGPDGKVQRPDIKSPDNIKGFIVAMPWLWTAGENNDSRLNKLIIAYLNDLHNPLSERGVYYADASQPSGSDTPSGSAA